MLDFGIHLAPSGVQNGTQNDPSGDKMPPPKLWWCSKILFLKPTCSQGRFRSAPGHHFGRFGMDFWWNFKEFGISLAHFSTILATTLQITEATKLVDPITHTVFGKPANIDKNVVAECALTFCTLFNSDVKITGLWPVPCHCILLIWSLLHFWNSFYFEGRRVGRSP